MNTDAALEAELAFRELIFTRPCRSRRKKQLFFSFFFFLFLSTEQAYMKLPIAPEIITTTTMVIIIKQAVYIYFHIMYVWQCCKGFEAIHIVITPGCS